MTRLQWALAVPGVVALGGMHEGVRTAVHEFAGLFTKEVVCAWAAAVTLVVAWLYVSRRRLAVVGDSDGCEDTVLIRRAVSHEERVALADGAAKRAAAVVGMRLRRGFGTLRAVSGAAVLVGVGGTCLGIVGSFRGVCGNAETGRAIVNALLAQSLAPTALGLAVALSSKWMHDRFAAQAQAMAVEMDGARIEMVNALRLLR